MSQPSPQPHARPGDVWASTGKPLKGFGGVKVRLTNDMLFFERGTLRSDAQQIRLLDIGDVDATQSMAQKARGVGSIRIHTNREIVTLEDLPDHRQGVDAINHFVRLAHQQAQQRQNTHTYAQQPAPQQYQPPQPQRPSSDEVFSQIERLGEMRDKGYITAEDFDAKKRELLSRL